VGATSLWEEGEMSSAGTSALSEDGEVCEVVAVIVAQDECTFVAAGQPLEAIYSKLVGRMDTVCSDSSNSGFAAS